MVDGGCGDETMMMMMTMHRNGFRFDWELNHDDD